VIAGLIARLGLGRIATVALRLGLLVAGLLLLLLSLRRSGERLGRVLERLETSERTHDVQRRMLEARLVVLAIAASLPSGCGTAGSEDAFVTACPPIVDYGADLQVQAAAELLVLPEGSAVATLLSDYAVMRDQARACDTP
jgi:hypothetical protein